MGGWSHDIGSRENRGLSELFYSGMKRNLDLDWLPTGKFSINDLVLNFGATVYNVLQIIGQEGHSKDGAPIRHAGKKRGILTTIQ
ncbi:MAG: hypothetical protein WHS86_00430 [Desulfosoma sp.]